MAMLPESVIPGSMIVGAKWLSAGVWNMFDVIGEIRKKISERTKVCKTISAEDIWTSHGVLIWEADNFTGTSHFYPVYKWKNFYSYSLLALIVKKGKLNLDRNSVDYFNRSDFICLPASLNIDKDIVRIGEPHQSKFSIIDVENYARKIANALCADIQQTEKKNVGYTNYILCGGKDSLNLLLLPWAEKVVALSAEPNYEFVKKFVLDNNLDIETRLLEDKKDMDELDHEALECCCRIDMMHWRWGAHLKEISLENNGEIIYWKGQLGDAYTSDKWKVYMHPIHSAQMFIRKVYKKLEPITPFVLKRAVGHYIQPKVIQALWERGAVMQGAHLAFLREITDTLVLSAYHGPEVMKVWQGVDLGSVAQRDMRERIGEILLNRPVIYPAANPAPEPSMIRKDLGCPSDFVSMLKESGIQVIDNAI